jgi:alpha-1,6-mannosyltransferase
VKTPLGQIAAAGLTFTAATVALVLSAAQLGTPIFFACVGAATAAYIFILRLVWQPSAALLRDRRTLLFALAFAVVFRIPLAATRIDAGNDMFRYIWDGRVQRLGYNPYNVLPSDPALAATHYDDTTRLMPSRDLRTFYPAAAQLFFRLVVTIRDSVHAMKLALLACDLLTIVIVWRWLAATRRSEWLALAYAWNPLVVLESALSGHVDALCAASIAASAYFLTRRWRTLAAAAFAIAVAAKLLPIVLLPLFWRRIRVRDAVVGAGVLAALYLPFILSANPLASMGFVVQGIRFNGPLFLAATAFAPSAVAAALAVSVGLLVALVCRFRLSADHPAAWAWPMAASLAFAPSIYPWYLVSVTPFLLLPSTLPLVVWTLTISSTYLVWQLAAQGQPWAVPAGVLALEYGFVSLAALAALRKRDVSADERFDSGLGFHRIP